MGGQNSRERAQKMVENLPDAVRFYLDEKLVDVPVDVRLERMPGAVQWLIEALSLVHECGDLKAKVRELLAVELFTRNLHAATMPEKGQAFDAIRTAMRNRLEQLGTELKALYDSKDLGCVFSDAAVAAATTWHPKGAEANETGTAISQADVMPELAAAFDYVSPAVESMFEQQFLHGLMVAAHALNPMFHAKAAEVAARHGMTEDNYTFQPQHPKSFERALSKMQSGAAFRYMPSPKAGFNVDVCRCCYACDVHTTLPFLRDLLAEFGGAVEIKNFYSLPETERAAHFHMPLLTVTVEFRPGLTWRELLERPESRDEVEAYCATSQGRVPAERWARHTAAVRKVLEGKMGETQAALFVELQILAVDAMDVRYKMREVCRVYHRESPEQLFSEFSNPAQKEATSLWDACKAGQVSVAERFLDNGADVNESKRGFTGLYIASQNSNADVVHLLLDKGAAVDQICADAPLPLTTPLTAACQFGHTDIVRQLLDHGAGVDLDIHSDFWSPLRVSSFQGFTDVVQLLLDRGASVNQADSGGHTPLFYALARNHVDIVRILFDHDAAVDMYSVDSCAPLHVAAAGCGVEIVQCLLDRGAVMDHARADGVTALICASEAGATDVVRLLLDRGAEPNKVCSDGRTPLFIALLSGHADVASLLLDKGAAVDKATKDGHTPLLVASEDDDADAVRLLLDHGAAVNHTNNRGDSPLLVSAERGHTDVVRLLLDRGADVNYVNDVGGLFSALSLAAKTGSDELVRLLIDKGADVDQADADGRTPAFLAALESHTHIVHTLLDRGAAVDHVDVDGRTLLHVASEHGDAEAVQRLLDEGARPDAVDNNAQSAAHEAAANGHASIADTLQRAMDAVNQN